jgi:hypothetical protein
VTASAAVAGCTLADHQDVTIDVAGTTREVSLTLASVGCGGPDGGAQPDGANPDRPDAGSDSTTGGAGGASPPDARPPDAPASGGAGGSSGDPANLCPAGTARCFDFEAEDIGRAPHMPWTVDANGGSVVVETTRSVSGRKSAHVTAGTGGSSVTMTVSTESLPSITEHYGRLMLWVDVDPADLPAGHWNLFEVYGPSGKTYQEGYAVGGFGRGIEATYSAFGGTLPNEIDCRIGGGPLATRKWTCLEWHVSRPQNELQLWVDGAADPAIQVIDTGGTCDSHALMDRWIAPDFDHLSIGHIGDGSAVPQSLWIDDVALSTRRIGCPMLP